MPKMMHPCLMHNVCIVETQDLHSGNTRSGICILETQDLGSVLWKHKICILGTQDPRGSSAYAELVM